MKISQNPPAYLIMRVTSLLDRGDFDYLTCGEIRQHASDRDLLPWLRELAGPEFDISVFSDEGPWAWFGPYLYDFIQATLTASSASDLGVTKKGLCLLVALSAEIIRRGEGWKPTDDIARDLRTYP